MTTVDRPGRALGDEPGWATARTTVGEDAALLSADEERTWGVARRTQAALLVAPLVGAVVVALTLVDRPLYRWVTREDGPLEWAQFAVNALGAVVAAAVAVVLLRRGRRGVAVLWLGFALGLTFIAGEEISWGQRVLGRETPEALRQINQQDETNVHNIVPVQETINIVFLLVGAYGSLVALAVRRRWVRTGRRPAWGDLFVPPVCLFTLFLLVFGYKLARVTLFPEPRFVIVKYGEYVELCTAVALALFAGLTLRRLRRGPDGPAGPGAVTTAPGARAGPG